MKLILFFSFTWLTLFAHYHEPSVTLYGDWDKTSSFPTIYTTFHHQSSLDLEDGNIIILHALTSPHSPKTFHHELGVGYRKLFENFGLGISFVYANRNTFGFYNHQFSPGLEVFYDHFSLTYNQYKHLKSGVEFKKSSYLFHDVSELTLSYHPSKKYEFSFTPLYNHITKKVGYRGGISAYFYDNWKLSLIPYCEPKVKHGIAFSLGYHFGGAKKKRNLPLDRSHRFFYATDAKSEFYDSTHSKVIFTPPAPVFSPSTPMPEKDEDVKEDIIVNPPKPKTFIDRLFFWR